MNKPLSFSSNTRFVTVRTQFLMAAVLLGLWNASAQAQTITVSNLWGISTADGRNYVTSGSTERGIAHNPATGHVLLVSRAAGLEMAILDANTGAELGFVDTTGISGGTFALSLIGVADDGAIYGGNLSGSATGIPAFRLYRWADEASTPALVFVGNPGIDLPQRWGDTLDVRGAGTNTQVLIASQGTMAAILAPDTNSPDPTNTFMATRLDVAGITSGDLQKGVAFGTNNTFYGKHTGSGNVRYLSFDLGAGGMGTATLITNFPVATAIAGISIDTTNRILAGVQTSQSASGHQVTAYDISTPGVSTLIGSVPLPTPNVATPNAVAGIDIGGGRIFAVDTANGIVAAQIVVSTGPAAPSIVTDPASQTAVEGGYVTFRVSVVGTPPLGYQWRFNETNNLAGATGNSLTVTNLQLADAGTYSVVATNVAGSATSTNATLAVTPSVRSSAATLQWSLSPGARLYLTPDNNNQRGLAYNPATTNLILVTRSPSNAVVVLDARTGAEVRILSADPAVVVGGTFAVNMVGVADDGAVYVANLVTTASTGFKIYKWDSDSAAVPIIVYGSDGASSPDGAERWGDTMDVRGGGTNAQIILASRDNGKAAIFTTTDGINFAPTIITVADAAADTAALGLAFGAADTYWTKNSGGALRHVQFDLSTGIGTVLQSFAAGDVAGNILPIGVDPTNNLLAGISLQTPDNVRLFDISVLTSPPVGLDTDFFSTDNANDNGTGSVEFAGDRLFVLDTNNGILALAVQRAPVQPGPIAVTLSGSSVILTWPGPGTLQSSTNVAGGYDDIDGATRPHTNAISSAPQQFFRLRN